MKPKTPSDNRVPRVPPGADKPGRLSATRVRFPLMARMMHAEPMNAQAFAEALAAHAQFIAEDGGWGSWSTMSIGEKNEAKLIFGVYIHGRNREAGGKQARLCHENLEGLPLRGVALPYADMAGIRCRDQDLSTADLTGALLIDSDLTGSSFSGARLVNADLSRAELINCNFRYADLTGTDFENADLTGADLRGAQIYGTRFPGAILDGTLFDVDDDNDDDEQKG